MNLKSIVNSHEIRLECVVSQVELASKLGGVLLHPPNPPWLQA